MAYLQAAFTPLFSLRINEKNRHFTVRSALATWNSPNNGAIFGNHKSTTVFQRQATELEFHGRLGHKHAIALVRETDRTVMAIIEVDETGVASMRHANIPTARMVASPETFEHVALLVGFPNELFTMCVFDERHADTDLIRYQPTDAKFYIPQQYLSPQDRVSMANRSNAMNQAARSSANEKAGPSKPNSKPVQPKVNTTEQATEQPPKLIPVKVDTPEDEATPPAPSQEEPSNEWQED